MSKARDLANAGTALTTVSATELGYLDGVTSAVQTQINAQIPDSLLTTKGDLIAATGASTPARLGVGTDGQVLTADAASASGVKWATAAAGDKSKMWPKDSSFYLKPYHTSTTNFTLVEDRAYYIPIYLPNYALNRIGIRTSSNPMNIGIRLGIYNTDLTTGRPSTVYLDAGTVTATAINTNYEITISTTPPAGYYWLAVCVQTVTSGSTELIALSNTAVQYGNFGQTTFTLNDTTYLSSYTQSGVTGAFATAGTLDWASNNPPLVAVRMA